MERRYQSFEELKIWKDAMKLSIEIYKLFKNCRDFNFGTKFKGRVFPFPHVLPGDSSDRAKDG